MTTATKKTNVEIYGPNGDQVAELISRLSELDWYSSIGIQHSQSELVNTLSEFTKSFNQDGCRVAGLTIEKFPAFLEGMKLESSPLWSSLQQIPIQISEKLRETGRQELLVIANDIVPEQVFHGAYDGAYKQLEEAGSTAISFCTGAGMYIAGLAVAWELLGDLEGFETNPIIPLIEVLEKGHLPLGLYDYEFFVI